MKYSALLTFTASLLIASHAFAASTCETFASTMTKHVVSIFHDTAQNEEQKRAALSVVFDQAVDTDWIAKFVLGRFWKSSSAEEQAEYLKDYKTYITRNYISKFNDEDAMSVDDIVIAGMTQPESGQWEAKTLIKRKGDDDVRVDYLLDEATDHCKVHDIKVEGVSLLTTQRSEFSALANSSGIKGVIAALQNKITQ